MPKYLIRSIAGLAFVGAVAGYFGSDNVVDPLERVDRYDMAENVALVSNMDDQGYPQAYTDQRLVTETLYQGFQGIEDGHNRYLIKLKDMGLQAHLRDGAHAPDHVVFHLSEQSGGSFQIPKDRPVETNSVEIADIIDTVSGRDDQGLSIFGSYTTEQGEITFKPVRGFEFNPAGPEA